MDELASKVPVGEWINIDNFSLTGVGRTYCTTNNPLKMNFLHNTDISESTLRIENNFLDLVDFETIQSGKPDPNILIDVIGQVLDLGDLDTVHCAGGKQRKKLEFTFRHIKFKIHLLVKDDTGESSFMLLDPIATGIVPQSAEYLLNGSLDEPEENAEFPDAITSLIGQTFMFGVYIEKDNATGGGVCYKVGKVWKDLSMLKICGHEESSSANTQGTTNSLFLSECNETASTPSKRKSEENKEVPDITSTSKKQCTKVFKEERK
ncbi:hypothetical protein F2Q69_00031641 [Brassica cretica]|uniref:DUF223 domain-containing protein n=1 Tax=Brassica cretica TaxID=69181 RepID=A0A8S9S322_BRACR|nr:hypothetical protein F2Q69_00031641 [Brassica cretica]